MPMMNVGMARMTADRRRMSNWRCSLACIRRARSSRDGGFAIVTLKGGVFEFAIAETMSLRVKVGASGV